MFDAGTPLPGVPLPIDGTHPRFTMIGGDFETVRGEWSARRVAPSWTMSSALRSTGRLVKAGSIAAPAITGSAGRCSSITKLSRSDSADAVVVVLGAVGRSAVLARALCAAGLRRGEYVRGIRLCPRHRTGELGDNLALEGSIGWFVGEGRDLIGRFADSDFIYVRLKHYF